MNQTIEESIKDIGLAALNIANDIAGKLLVYSEVEDGVISADLFYVNQAGVVRFRFCPESMQNQIYALWENWKDLPGNREWRVMCYTINDGKFSIDLTYPDQIQEKEGLSDRRPKAIKQYFGSMKVDYKRPS